MSLQNQSPRVGRKPWTNPNELATEVNRVLSSQDIVKQAFPSRNLAPNILNYTFLADFTLTTAGTTYDIIGAAKEVKAVRDSVLLATQNVIVGVPAGTGTFTFTLTLTGPSGETNDDFVVYSANVRNTTSLIRAIPVRKGLYGVVWKCVSTVGLSKVYTTSNLTIIPFANDFADMNIRA